MLADQIKIANWDAGERAIAESLGDLLAAPDLAPGDAELLAPWLAWCKGKSVRHAPAKSWCVAAFVLDRHKQGATEQQIFDLLGAITRLHAKFNLSDPCTGPVHTALERFFEIKPPRSWPKEDKALWSSLPGLTRLRISAREQQRDTELRRIQNERAAEIKKQQPDEAKAPVTTEKVI